jgi:hypothetical protein
MCFHEPGSFRGADLHDQRRTRVYGCMFSLKFGCCHREVIVVKGDMILLLDGMAYRSSRWIQNRSSNRSGIGVSEDGSRELQAKHTHHREVDDGHRSF